MKVSLWILAFNKTTRFWGFDWFVSRKQIWLLSKLDHCVLIIVTGVAPLMNLLLDLTEEWWDGGEVVRQTYNEEYVSWSMSGTSEKFAKAAWLQYTDSRENCFQLPSLEAHQEFLSLCRGPALWVNIEIMANNVATDVGDSRANNEPSEYGGTHFKDWVWIHEVKCVGYICRFQDVQEPCRVMCLKVSETVADAVEVETELVK